MRIITLHSDFLEVEPKKRALKSAPEVPLIRERFEECLVVFTGIEPGDARAAEKAADEIQKVSQQVKTNKIVVYPWVHLTSAPAKPDEAIESIAALVSALKARGLEVSQSPFGWYKAFSISVKGHPLSELSREIHADAPVKEEKIDVDAILHSIQKTNLDRERLKENDHRIIGQNLDLFSFYNVAPGMVFWHPKGLAIWNELVAYWREEHKSAGYQEIRTPQVMSDVLWKASGHWGHYKENIFITEYEKRNFAVKPMNCPGAMLVYGSRTRSYRELPLRMCELGVVHRLELSGVLAGLFRVVQFTQDDAHIFCTEQQLESEIDGVIALVDKFYRQFGFEYRMELSTMPENAMGSKGLWDEAESALKSALDKRGAEYKINEGDGAFYGPKIDFHVKDSQGRSWQLATLQLDFQMPERFKLKYVGEDGKDHRPIMLHRVVYGALERFMGIILEHYNGNLPLWLAPVQVRVLSFSEKNAPSAQRASSELSALGFRADFDIRPGTVESKVRDAELQKIPYIVVIGDKEEQAGTLAVRRHGEKGVKFGVKPEEFEARLRSEASLRE